MKPLTHEWIEKAEGDYRVILILRRTKQPVYEAICYHAQQCAEKYLKGWLVEYELPAPKIHDIEVLTRACLPTLAELSGHISNAIYLTSYAIDIR